MRKKSAISSTHSSRGQNLTQKIISDTRGEECDFFEWPQFPPRHKAEAGKGTLSTLRCCVMYSSSRSNFWKSLFRGRMSKSTKGNRGRGEKRRLRSNEETEEEKLTKTVRLHQEGEGLSLRKTFHIYYMLHITLYLYIYILLLYLHIFAIYCNIIATFLLQ